MTIIRLKEEKILMSADGPDHNVLKFKPPMCFTSSDVDELVDKLDLVLAEVDVVPQPEETIMTDHCLTTAEAGKFAAQPPRRLLPVY